MSIYSPGQFKILCIEDEAEILRDIVVELADHGFTVGMALSGEAALPMIEADKPDLIVCDMQMSGMSGRQLLETLRLRGDAIGSTPFIFLTAFGDRETMLTGRRAGADDYLIKPVDYDLLIAAVESHLHNAKRRNKQGAQTAQGAAVASFDGRTALMDRLEALPPATPIALVSFDNIGELRRRFSGRNDDYAAALATRVQSMSGVSVFQLDAHGYALIGGEPERFETILKRLMRSRVRDRTDPQLPPAIVTASIITAATSPAMKPVALLDEMIESLRFVQREGGQRKLAIGDSHLADLRLANAIRTELVGAIRAGQLHVCFQPKVSAADGTPVAGEVLVRWVSPLLGQLSPATFIPIVERAGLLPHVTDWVLRQAAIAQLSLARQGLVARLAVNIGASEFSADLPDRIAAVCAETGADPSLIEIEITETTLMTDLQSANNVTHALHANGMVVALDDFGTGFSSLSYLRQCDVDAIKIDRSFVERISEAESDRKIVGGIINLAKDLGLETIAEGVETEAQRDWLCDQGCDVLQGYLIARPLRFEDYCALLRRLSR